MRRGWCPGIHDPMPSGDGWLARVKPRRARLNARALRDVADAAERYGNGVVELTRRGYLQIRGLRAASVGAFAGAMVAAGLADADPARERRRRVICAPPFEDGLAARIEAMQEASADWDRLPDKFAVSVNCADGDIQLIGGRTFVAGGALATRADPVAAVARLVAAGLSLGGGRMSALVAAHGAPALFAAAGLPTSAAERDPVPAAQSFGVAFGHLTVATLRGLAALAADCRGFVLLTPRRSVILEGADDAIRARAAALGLLIDPADRTRDVVACVGQPACAGASVPARADAAYFARVAARPPVGGLHVSGCAKGCARSAPAAVTLVGRDGLYDVVLNGRADAAPVWRGLTREAAAAAIASL